jgi:predicted ferric reductase
MRGALRWACLVMLAAVPVVLAAASPLLEWRQPVYVAAGFAGVIGLAVMLFQPLLAGGLLPGLGAMRGRMGHRLGGALLLVFVLVHVVGLWITSPPDVVDALLFRSPTPFSVWGVLAMWAVIASAALAPVRRRIGLRLWRNLHTGLVVVIVGGTVAHALLIEGTMEDVSKIVLSVAVIAATVKVVADRRGWTAARRT